MAIAIPPPPSTPSAFVEFDRRKKDSPFSAIEQGESKLLFEPKSISEENRTRISAFINESLTYIPLTVNIPPNPTYYEDNLKIITDRFEREFVKYASSIALNETEAKKIFKKTSRLVANINFKAIAVEISPLNAVKFSVILDDRKELYITKSFSSLPDLNDGGVVFSLFVDQKLIISDAAKLDSLVQGINKYISM